ncbi:long-chain fatty alcohol dehydrogenase [Hypoxylon sp. FL0890]|nr:long-chain fatty alcohol dehydrogenase [Hypoxylon sp. FL0890]
MASETAFPEPQLQALLTLLDAAVPSVKVVDSSATDNDHLCISQEEFDGYYHDIKRSMKCPPSKEAFRDYLAVRPSDNPLFVKLIRKIMNGLSTGPKLRLYRILSLMMTRLGSLISTGYFTPFNSQSITVREAILRSWRQSWFFIWPMLARTIVRLAAMTWSRSDPIFHGLSAFKGYRINSSSEPAAAFDFNFMKFDASPEPASIETDILVVGSGCGGGVCAKVLAEAGHRVLVVDKGYYMPPSQLPIGAESVELLFEGRTGGLSNVDGSMVLAAGSCWGGGGTVNWSASMPTPDLVRKEWADVNGLKFFATSDFQDSLDRVSDFMGLGKFPTQQNHANTVLLEGSKKLGWRAQAWPPNTGPDHSCGSRCANGCRESKKQGPAVSWLPAAAKAGARCIEGFEVSEVLFEDSNGLRNATGVLGKWTSRDEDGNFRSTLKPTIQRLVYVKAKKTIISAGGLHTPLILSRSGLKNPHIGRNLHLHPTLHYTAIFDKDIHGWEGEMVTSVVTEFENLDGEGHGFRIECSSMLPHTTFFQVPWDGGLQFKLDAIKYRQMNCFMALTRDRGSGSIIPDPNDGSPVIAYTPSHFDRQNMIAGAEAISKLCYIQGAAELFPMVPGLPRFKSSKPVHDRDIKDADFVQWLSRLREADPKPSTSVYGSAHQMGTCRMSTSQTTGVVNENGAVWGTKNLYVADASVFPSGSGANPMVTIMAVADYIAKGISQQILSED